MLYSLIFRIIRYKSRVGLHRREREGLKHAYLWNRGERGTWGPEGRGERRRSRMGWE